MEGVSAVPGIGQQLDEKSTSEKQARFMAAAAHNPDFAKKTGMDTDVAKEFNKADTGTKQLSNAMKDNTNEGAHTQHYLDANKPSKVRQDAEIAKAEKERKDAKEAEKAKKKVNESYTGDEGIDTIIDEILSGASDNYMTMDDALVKVSTYLLNAGYSNDEVLDIMDNVEAELHDQDMDGDTDDGYNDSYDMSDDAAALASAGHGSDEDYYPDTDGMDSPTDFDEYEMNADDSFDEGTSIDDLFADDEPDPEIENEENPICPACNGSGEGMYDGTKCRSCGGSGVERREADFDDFDEPDFGDDGREPWDGPLEETGLNNGYDKVNKASGADYFPNGAEAPVTANVGPSGAKQGDNPEQKKMQVAEVHKELVYGYRNYLKESAKK
jgi:hypothetical protein